MKSIQKAATAVIALTITFLGTAFVTAPFALANVQPVSSHQVVSAPCAAHRSCSMSAPDLRHG